MVGRQVKVVRYRRVKRCDERVVIAFFLLKLDSSSLVYFLLFRPCVFVVLASFSLVVGGF